MGASTSSRPPHGGPSRPAEPSRRPASALPRRLPLLLALALVPAALGLFAAAPAPAQTDNRPSVQFREVTYVISEVYSTPLRVEVTVTPALSVASTVQFRISSSQTTHRADYNLAGLRRVGTAPGVTGTWYVDLPAGATSRSVYLWPVRDKLTEDNENVVFNLVSIDTANAPYKIGTPASTEVVLLDDARGPNPDSSGVFGALPWVATLTVQDVSRSRGSNPMATRKKKDTDGNYIACTDNNGLADNESCVHGFVYEKVLLSSISGTTSFPSVGCRNDREHGDQCFPPHALTDNGFRDGSVGYRIAGVTLSGETLTFTLDRPLTEPLKAAATLTVNNTTVLRLADASHINGAYQWGGTGLSWSADNPVDQVVLRLERSSGQILGGEGPGSGEEEQRDPLTAAFETVPEEHDGHSAFTLDVRLSETVGKFSRSPRVSSFAVTQGRVTNVEQVGAGLWRVTVQPASSDDVTVTLAGGRDCGDEPSGAVCAPDGRALSNTSSATVGGPEPQKQIAEYEPQEQIVEYEPGPVVNLQLSVKGKKIIVSWEAPASGGAVDNYIAHLKPADGTDGKKTRRPNAGKTTTTFRKLEPGATYKVWVRAQNETGKGERVYASVTLPDGIIQGGEGEQH